MPPSQSTASTAKTRVFPGVTLAALMSLNDQSSIGGETGGGYKLALDADGVGGLLTLNVGVGDVIVRFSHNSDRNELTVTIVKKPMLLPTAAIWAGTSQVLRQAAERASSSASKPVGGD